ncbi:hypothetical protein ABFS82_06G157900 [Erythranthe guttata]|uniref:uncharacterized protein LOC105957304 n=1 Tax=Erythranthe guttata TaxID=4155 RepID=UPI00064DC552|nr:PREDICTED: uncharacterized protein LOC105957304 [Erythranthe guttata]|eukprot:XP_012836692.1 PREDICTED: uncharacterized protein LOC105957304 [Erythranthe guttata]
MGRKRRYYKYGDARTKIDTMNTLINKLELELEEEEKKKNNKLELANLIYEIREQLEIVAAEKKRINRRLFIKAVDRRKRLVYDRDSTSSELRNCKKARFLNKSAKIALGYYRRTNLPHNNGRWWTLSEQPNLRAGPAIYCVRRLPPHLILRNKSKLLKQ